MRTIISIILCSFLIASISPLLLIAQEKESAYYVSLSGKDAWSGRLADPNGDKTDGPFASLERARDEIRLLKKSDKFPRSGRTVYIRGGIYSVPKTFELSAEDSGLENAPVIWRAYPNEEVRLSGAKIITDFERLSNQSAIKRIDATYHDKIVQINLKAQGITNYGILKPTGFVSYERESRLIELDEALYVSTGTVNLDMKRYPTAMELFFNNKPMTLARYPNEGWVTIADVPQSGELKSEGQDRYMHEGIPRGRHYGRFTYSGDRPGRWEINDDMWMFGYWMRDWADQYQRIAIIDAQKREIYPAEPYHPRGYTKGQRYYYCNILEELNSPGEWYLDRESGILYFFPPSPIEKGETYVSLFEDLLLSMKGTSYIAIENIIFEGTRAGAIHIKGGANNTIAGCTIRNVGTDGIIIDNGLNNGIMSCDIYEMGDCGIILHGGDRKTLTPAGNHAVNNHIHHFSRINHTYRPAISISGVGNRAAHNRIHDAHHMAIGWAGNEHIVEYNEIYDVVLEGSDSGAIYNGRNPSEQGNIFRHNYFHHIGKFEGQGTAAIYFDDGECGNTVYGNIFYKTGVPGHALFGAVFIHGGRYNVIDNNIFIDCTQAYGETWWDNKRWENYYDEELWQEQIFKQVDISKPPYSTRYPWLVSLKHDNRLNVLSRNLVYKCASFLGRGTQELIDNLVTDEAPGFVDAANENLMLRDDSYVYKKIAGFKMIPFDKIGLYRDEYRSSISVK